MCTCAAWAAPNGTLGAQGAAAMQRAMTAAAAATSRAKSIDGAAPQRTGEIVFLPEPYSNVKKTIVFHT